MWIKMFCDYGVRYFSVDTFEALDFILNEFDDPDFEYI